MKLFDINIVASSLFGLCNKTCIFLIKLSLELSGIFVLSNEKKATSHPEVSAEKTRNINIKMIFIIIEVYYKWFKSYNSKVV